MAIWIKEDWNGKKVGYEVQKEIVIPKYEGEMKLDYMKK